MFITTTKSGVGIYFAANLWQNIQIRTKNVSQLSKIVT